MMIERVEMLQNRRRQILEIGLVVSLGIHILLFQSFKRSALTETVRTIDPGIFQVEDIPQTRLDRTQPAPARPMVPIASEDEDLPEDLTIDDTVLNLNDEAPLLPDSPALGDDMPMFIPWDEPAVPVGGFAAIQKNLIYPDLARRAGIEGKVVVNAKINVDGTVKYTRIMKSIGFAECDRAAADAIKSVQWKAAKQRDLPVEVWVAVTVTFQLHETD